MKGTKTKNQNGNYKILKPSSKTDQINTRGLEQSKMKGAVKNESGSTRQNGTKT